MCGMDSWPLRTALIAAVILIVGVTLYGGVNLLCQMNVRSCVQSSECASAAICIDHKCTPRMCAPISQSISWAAHTSRKAWRDAQTWLYTQRK